MTRINRSLILSRASPILNFYSKHRNFILRLCYVAILFGALSSSSGKKNKNSQDKNKNKNKLKDTENEKDKLLNSNYTNNETNNTNQNEKLSLLQKLVKPFKSFMETQTIKILASIDYTKEGKPIIIYLVLQIAMLIIRAILTLKVASLDGLLVSSLVSRRFKKFFKLVVVWMLIGIPAALTNSMLNLSQRLLGKHIRFNVTKQLLDEYLPDDGNSTLYQLLTNNRDSGENNKIKSKDKITLKSGDDKFQDSTDASSSSSSSNSNKTIKIEDPNQRITLNVEQLSSSLSILPGQLLKPSLDILLCANQLAKSGGNTAEGVLALGLITNLSSLVLKMFTPNFIKLSQKSNELENKFHIYHSKIVNNNEEISLAKGHRREIDVIDSNYYELVKFKKFEMRRMAIYNFFMSFIVKYFWGASGLTLCAVPIFSEAYQRNFQISDHLMQNISATFITNRRLLLSGSSSLGRLIQSKKDIQNLIGYSDKVWEFHLALSQINNDRLVESSINGSRASFPQDSYSPSVQDILSDSSNSTATNGSVALAKSDSLASDSSFVAPLITGPNVLYGDCVKFDNIPLVTPKGDTLIERLNFEIKTGQNLLIIGPNGCGKSSLFRILGGLWPVLNPGKLTIPNDKNDLFYLPQRAYLTIGTLKEQIIYPDSLEDYSKKLNRARLNNEPVVKDDEFLINLLNVVDLSHLVDECTNIIEERLEISNKTKGLIISESVIDLKELNGGASSNGSAKTLKRVSALPQPPQPHLPPLKRTNSKVAAASESFEDDDELNVIPESPLDLVRKWPNLLSVGEQQRLALARLYYHCPKFAVLDECTSSISPELEQKCYRYAVENCKITVLSVCHRTSLWKFHNHILKFDGLGNAKFHKFDPELRLKKHNELIEIDNYLKNLNNLQNKLKDLNHLKNSTANSIDTLPSLPAFPNNSNSSYHQTTKTPSSTFPPSSSSSSSSSASGSTAVSGNNSPAPTRSSKTTTDRKKIMYIE